MECLKAPLAILLCWSLAFPAPLGLAQEATASAAALPSDTETIPNPPRRQAYRSDLIQGDDRILQALNRFTFGPKPGDLEAVRKMGLENWFDEQLHPGSLDEKDLNAKLGNYPAMQWTPEDLMFRAPNNAVIRQATNGKAPMPDKGTLRAVYENQIFRLQLKKEGLAGKKAQAASAAQPQAAAGDATSAAAPAAKGAVQNDSMAANADASMAAPQSMTAPKASNQNPADMSQPAQTNQGQMASGAANGSQPGMQPGTVSQAGNPPQVVEPLVSPAEVREILALPPDQRVERLSQMQPDVFDSFIKSIKGPQRQLMIADLDPGLRECVEDLENPRQMVVGELMAQRLTRDIYSNAQLQEVMTDFWFNHFNVFVGKDEPEPYYLVSYERDVIRPRSLGKFEDLLEAVAHSPAMLLYLDNAQSVGPDSFAALRARENDFRRPKDKRQAPQGLNENYARELMELHTLGVNGGYTQADVTQVARILTGWGIDRPQQGGGFEFNPMRHEPGTKVVMGQKFKEDGEVEGRELLHFLATRPATAQFLSRKLAMRFVSDDPPQALVDRMAKTYLSSGGDISAVLSTLFHSPEFWAANDFRAKVKTPLEFVVSAVRASGAQVDNMQPLVQALRQMGMPLYGAVPPTGYKWDAADWVSTGALVDRMNFALSLAANRLPGITVEWAPDVDINALMSDDSSKQVVPTPESEESRLEPLLIAGGASDATRDAALKEFEAQNAQSGDTAGSMAVGLPGQAAKARPGAPGRINNRAPAPDAYEREDQLLAGLLLGSPEFQRR
jgi:uncharacterized protein (DUF1800 family)